ncbi:MAG TPA: hypothetical protein VE954_43040 [Oligoflexus sp.]|uniref:hypothetical protein n=1 Tax=Oligoflexus sp. TaxID=1971216 RepID=UPI002D259066|nr:hypothetical protein [Oligoflexus sp.]HYX39920.1 hypothetical protein [Oligoflexus sp.]
MARVWGLVLLALLAGEGTWNSAILYESLQTMVTLRQRLLVNPHQLRLQVCATENTRKSGLFWNEQGRWVDACQSSRNTGYLPRIWRITWTHNYRMLFLREVPITFAIVIKR